MKKREKLLESKEFKLQKQKEWTQKEALNLDNKHERLNEAWEEFRAERRALKDSQAASPDQKVFGKCPIDGCQQEIGAMTREEMFAHFETHSNYGGAKPSKPSATVSVTDEHRATGKGTVTKKRKLVDEGDKEWRPEPANKTTKVSPNSTKKQKKNDGKAGPSHAMSSDESDISDSAALKAGRPERKKAMKTEKEELQSSAPKSSRKNATKK